MWTIGRICACSAYGNHHDGESPQFVKNCQTAGCLPVCSAKRETGRTLPVTPFQTLPAGGRYGLAPAGEATTRNAAITRTRKRICMNRPLSFGLEGPPVRRCE